MSKYFSIRDKILEVFEKNIIPALENKELEYYELVNGLSIDLGIPEPIIEETIVKLKKAGKLKEVRYLAPSDEALISYLKKLSNIERETKRMDAEMLKIEASIKQEGGEKF